MPYFRFEKGFLNILNQKLTFFIVKHILNLYLNLIKKSSDTVMNFSLQNIHFKQTLHSVPPNVLIFRFFKSLLKGLA